MADVRITVGTFAFRARFERDAAPLTCARFESMLPYRERLIHVRWSGEACWIPLGGLELGLGYENATSYPAPGQLLFHPGGVSETEILLAYGSVRFASKVGQLPGNHDAQECQDRHRCAHRSGSLSRFARSELRGEPRNTTPKALAKRAHRRWGTEGSNPSPRRDPAMLNADSSR